MLYIIENNGVYGLTKGQFSASADVGTKAKRGEVNEQPPIDPVLTALALGGTFIARSFSGDKAQLVPLIKAGLAHKGFALIDVLSPCVTFNDHEDSTKSYAFTRQHYQAALQTDYVPPAEEIMADYRAGASLEVELHDGSRIVLRKTEEEYDPQNRGLAFARIKDKLREKEFLTGLLYVENTGRDMHAVSNTVDRPLSALGWEDVCPGSEAMAGILAGYR